MDISHLNDEEIVETFYNKKLQQTNQSLRQKNKGKGVKLNDMQKGCDTLVNSWIGKKYVIIKNEPIFY